MPTGDTGTSTRSRGCFAAEIACTAWSKLSEVMPTQTDKTLAPAKEEAVRTNRMSVLGLSMAGSSMTSTFSFSSWRQISIFSLKLKAQFSRHRVRSAILMGNPPYSNDIGALPQAPHETLFEKSVSRLPKNSWKRLLQSYETYDQNKNPECTNVHPRTKFIRGTTSVISKRDHLIGAHQLLCLVTGQTGETYFFRLGLSARE